MEVVSSEPGFWEFNWKGVTSGPHAFCRKLSMEGDKAWKGQRGCKIRKEVVEDVPSFCLWSPKFMEKLVHVLNIEQTHQSTSLYFYMNDNDISIKKIDKSTLCGI